MTTEIRPDVIATRHLDILVFTPISDRAKAFCVEHIRAAPDLDGSYMTAFRQAHLALLKIGGLTVELHETGARAVDAN